MRPLRPTLRTNSCITLNLKRPPSIEVLTIQLIQFSKTLLLLEFAHPPYCEVLQFSSVPEIHFFLNPRSIGIDRRYANLKRIGYLTRRMPASNQAQHFLCVLKRFFIKLLT